MVPAVPPWSGDELAARVLAAFEAYDAAFRGLARRFGAAFGKRDWREGQRLALERLLLYSEVLDELLEETRGALGAGAADEELWAEARAAFARLTESRDDGEIARTLFNSVARRAQGTVGVRPRTEFVGDEVIPGATPPPLDVRSYPAARPSAKLFERVLADLAPGPLADRAGDAEKAAGAVSRALRSRFGEESIEALELAPGVFFRNKGAYLVGRIVRTGGDLVPLVLALVHEEAGVRIDAVLTRADEASVVFGFSRSYFHADLSAEAGGARALVDFLHTLMPHRREDELFTSIGNNRHGKTLLFRALQEHLSRPGARLERAPGVPGLVMIVFTLPSIDVVFKVMRDRFGSPKRTSRRRVREGYRIVFLGDRVGRLADAQEFEGLVFPVASFTPDVLEELRGDAASAVHVDADTVTIDHLYTERRLTPLDIYLRQAAERGDEAAERAALLDYGQALEDLAAIRIFPGDLLLKNFGVTRHGRVVFYDYDELTRLTDVRFRELPQPRDELDELRAEPWFYVAENDVFPEELPDFLGIPERLREEFMARHGALFTAEFWQRMQERARSGDLVDFFPYPESRRLVRG